MEVPPIKKPRKEIPWSEKLEGSLVCNIVKHKAHLKTSGKTKDAKWKDVCSDLMVKYPEIAPDLTVEGIKKKFTRMKTTINNKYAVHFEGANLSGLPDEEDTPESVKLLINIMKEEDDAKDFNKAKKEKVEVRQQAMLVHEAAVLKPINHYNENKVLNNNSSQDSTNSSGVSDLTTVAPQTQPISFEQVWLENQRIMNEKRIQLMQQKNGSDEKINAIESNQSKMEAT